MPGSNGPGINESIKKPRYKFMENSLIRSQMPITEIMSIAKAFAESGMFPDTRQAAQAIVKIQAGQELGIAPFAAMTGIHIIKGRPIIGAGLIASAIKSSGKYDYKVKEMTDTNCSLGFYHGKTLLGNSSFSAAEARKAGTQNMDKFPKNMLFARAISNGVKWFTPDVFQGPVYTPEEMEVVTEEGQGEQVPLDTNQPSAKAEVLHEKKEQPDSPQIDPLWLDKMDQCKTKAEVLQVYKENKELIDASPELQRLLKETQTKLSNLKAA